MRRLIRKTDTDNSRMNIYNTHERSTAVIDLGAIRHNLGEFKRLEAEHGMDTGRILCSVKANAYGHGAVQVARAIEELTDYLGVACIDEGVELRKAGIHKPILLLGAALPDDFDAAVSHDITLTIFDIERARELDRSALEAGRRVKAHIAVDTGMSRIGLRPDELGLETVRQIEALKHIDITGVFTHFATADEADKTGAKEALERFKHFKELCIAEGLELGLWHCANTAAVIDDIGLGTDMDMARCGIGIYGLYPSDEVRRERIKLVPALKWYSCLSYVKRIEAHTSVSYGYNYTAERDMLIGTVACGYADGYPRILSTRGAEVIIRGRRCPIIGNICMDQMMVDLTNAPDAAIGDRVVLIGDAEDSWEGAGCKTQSDNVQAGNADADDTSVGTVDRLQSAKVDAAAEPVTADELAARCGTISYEIICGLSARTKRRYVGR